MIDTRTKLFIKRHLPPTILSRIQKVRARAWPPEPQVARLLSSFLEVNRSLDGDRIAMRPGIHFSIHPESREPFQYFCWKSVGMTEEYDRFLQMSQGARRFLDVGANHGVYSLAFSYGRPESSVLAIEPSPLAFPILLDNAYRNPLCQIECVQIAGSDKEETLRMRTAWHHVELIPERSQQTGSITDVAARPLDAVCEERQFLPDLIKVDVEGCELRCLRGLKRTLLTQRPPVCLELHPALIHSLGYSEMDIADFMDGIEYHFEDGYGRHLDRSFLNRQIQTYWVVLHPN